MALLAWARERGARWSDKLEIRNGARGRGVFTKTPIPVGELLLSLPATLAVRPVGKLADMVQLGQCSSLLALALTVLHELHVASPRSEFFEDLACMSLPSIPLLTWAPGDLSQLSGTSLLPAGVELEGVHGAADASFREDVLPIMMAVGEDYLPAACREPRVFSEALALVVSRALQGRVSYEQHSLWPYLRADGPPSAARGGSGPFMLPLVDLLNHTSEPAARGTILAAAAHGAAGGAPADAASVGDGWEMRAERPLEAGEEVLHSYGAHGAAELLRTYGFVEASRHTRVVVDHASVVRCARAAAARGGVALSESVAAARLDALREAGRLPLVFTLGGGKPARVPPLLLTAMQVLLMGEDEFVAWGDAGHIALGEAFVEEETLPALIHALLGLVEACSERRHAWRVPPPSAASQQRAGRSIRSGGDASCTVHEDAAVALAEALRREEAAVLLSFKRAAMMLEGSLADASGESEEEEGESEEEEGESEEEEGESGDGEEEEGEDNGDGAAGTAHEEEDSGHRGRDEQERKEQGRRWRRRVPPEIASEGRCKDWHAMHVVASERKFSTPPAGRNIPAGLRSLFKKVKKLRVAACTASCKCGTNQKYRESRNHLERGGRRGAMRWMGADLQHRARRGQSFLSRQTSTHDGFVIIPYQKAKAPRPRPQASLLPRSHAARHRARAAAPEPRAPPKNGHPAQAPTRPRFPPAARPTTPHPAACPA